MKRSTTLIRLAVALLLFAAVFQIPLQSAHAGCIEGQIMIVSGPICGCEDGQSTPKDRYKCIGGEWVHQLSYCGAPFCISG